MVRPTSGQLVPLLGAFKIVNVVVVLYLVVVVLMVVMVVLLLVEK